LKQWRDSDPAPVSGQAHDLGRVPGPSRTRGSILLVTLMVCLGIAVLISSLAAVTAAGRYALRAERTGRQDLADADTALAGLAHTAWRQWIPTESNPLPTPTPAGHGLVGGVADRHLLAWAQGPSMAATPGADPALVGSVALETSAWVERGADGFTVPPCMVVADMVTASPVRESSAVVADAASGTATVRSAVQPEVQVIGTGVAWEQAAPWALDEGTALLAEQQATRPGAAVVYVPGSPRDVVVLPSLPTGQGASPEMPLVVVSATGVDLIATGRGDLYALVLAGGSVRLEGTRLHGAVMASGVVDLGAEGQLDYLPSLVGWAATRSLVRVRLVPGSRLENLVPIP
jgi:hypothetical protein